MKGKYGFKWTVLTFVTFFAMAVSAVVYDPSVTGRALTEDTQMSESKTEAGISCELPGALVDPSERKTKNGQMTSARNIPPIDQKVPERILTATFALG